MGGGSFAGGFGGRGSDGVAIGLKPTLDRSSLTIRAWTGRSKSRAVPKRRRCLACGQMFGTCRSVIICRGLFSLADSRHAVRTRSRRLFLENVRTFGVLFWIHKKTL